jgi:hypothetical protein
MNCNESFEAQMFFSTELPSGQNPLEITPKIHMANILECRQVLDPQMPTLIRGGEDENAAALL